LQKAAPQGVGVIIAATVGHRNPPAVALMHNMIGASRRHHLRAARFALKSYPTAWRLVSCH
jgi:hypothetical protein